MARRFTSGTDGVTFPHDTALNIIDDLTICAWIKIRAQGSHSIVNKKQTGALTATPYIFQTANDASPARTQIYRRGTGTASSLLSSVGRVAFNVWKHVAVSHDQPSSTALFYFNAVLTDTVNGTDQTFTTNTQPLFIGDRNDIVSTQIDIAYVSIYNVILTAGEIATAMKFGYVNRGLVFASDDNCIADLSGNRRAATLNGATSVVSGPPYIVPYRFRRSAGDDYMSAAGGTPFTLTLNEALGLVDSRSNLDQKVTAETILLADTLARLTGKNLRDAIVLADVLARLPGKTLAEAVALVDGILKRPGKTLAEVLALVDTAPKITGKTLADALLLADTQAKLTGRALSDTLTLVDTVQKVLVIVRTFTETLVLLDTALKQARKTLPDTLVLADTARRATTKIQSDSLILSDSQIKSIGRTLSEILILADTLTKSLVLIKTLLESLILVDSLIRQPRKELREALPLVDTRRDLVQKLLTDAVILSDLLSRFTTRSLTDAFLLQDIIANQFIIQTGFLRMIASAARALTEISDELSRQYSEMQEGKIGKPSGLDTGQASGGYYREAGP